MHKLKVIEQDGIRVLTSKQLAEEYGTTTDTIKVNFTRNRRRFIAGKHYISLIGDDLKQFKNKVTECNLVGKTANILYLWTEKGALLHAKSLNTDKAWEVYDYLVDFYFRAKEAAGAKKENLQVSDEAACGWMERSMREAAEKAYWRNIGRCHGIVNGMLEKERGEMGSIMAVYGLLSDDGKALAMKLIQGEGQP